MEFTGDENHSVSLKEASRWTRKYREEAGQGTIKGGFFGGNAVKQLLDQEKAVGLRYYYGINDEDQPVLILVGVDNEGRDLVSGYVAELSGLCPPDCDNLSPLNG